MAGTAGRVRHRQQQKYAAQDAQQAQQYAEPQYAAPAEPDYMAELAQLAQLRDQGVITPEEFAAKKQQILGV